MSTRPSQDYLDHQKIAVNGYQEFLNEGSRFEAINRTLDIQMQAIVNGTCPTDASYCPPGEDRKSASSSSAGKTPTPKKQDSGSQPMPATKPAPAPQPPMDPQDSSTNPSPATPAKSAFRDRDSGLFPRSVVLPEIPAPQAAGDASIQQMSFQKPAAKVKSSVPLTPAAPRRVK